MSDSTTIIEGLRAFGLNKKQANIYLACLKLPRPTIQNISEESGIKRTSIYTMLSELEEKEVIKYTKEGKKTYIKAKSPQNLLRSIEEKHKEKRKRNIKSRQIITNSTYAREIVKKDIFEYRESRIIDHKYKLPVIEMIYENSVAIISSNFDDLIMVIKNKNVAETHKSYFEIIWQQVH